MLWSLFWFGVVYRSTKQDCSPSAWGNKPVFDPCCRYHLVLWGKFHFFLLFLPLKSQSLKCSPSGGMYDWLGCSERCLPKLQGWSWNMLLPIAMFWLLCFPPPSVTIGNEVSSLTLRVLTSSDLVSVLSCHFCYSYFAALTLHCKSHLVPPLYSRKMDWIKVFVCICPKQWRYAQVQSWFC